MNDLIDFIREQMAEDLKLSYQTYVRAAAELAAAVSGTYLEGTSTDPVDTDDMLDLAVTVDVTTRWLIDAVLRIRQIRMALRLIPLAQSHKSLSGNTDWYSLHVTDGNRIILEHAVRQTIIAYVASGYGLHSEGCDALISGMRKLSEFPTPGESVPPQFSSDVYAMVESIRHEADIMDIALRGRHE